MAASVFESPMFSKLFPTGDAARLFSDSAAVRAVLLVEGNLAKAQGELGLIPEDSAFFIHRSAMEVQIDPAGLAQDMTTIGFVPGITKAFAKAMEAPEHAKFIQHDADPDQLEAAALALRIRQFLTHCTKQLELCDLMDASKTALQAAITETESKTVGLYMDQNLKLASALGEALRLPLLPALPSTAPLAQLCSQLCATLAEAAPDRSELTELRTLTAALAPLAETAPAAFTRLSLAQICLAAAAALEIACQSEKSG